MSTQALTNEEFARHMRDMRRTNAKKTDSHAKCPLCERWCARSGQSYTCPRHGLIATTDTQ